MQATTDRTEVIPALITPLTSERAVHGDDLGRLITRALDGGATGVLVAGSTGEGALLTPALRAEVTRRAREIVDARPDAADLTLVAGASGSHVGALIDDVVALADAGADRVLVLAPATYPLSPDELIDLHVSVADRVEVPTLAYHIPQFTGSALTPDALRQLAGHPRIVGVKDSSDDAERRAEFVTAVSQVPDFAVFTGHAPTLRRALEAGAAGSITAVANLRLRQVVALHEAVAGGHDEHAAQSQADLVAASTALGAVGASMPAVIKAALQLDGTISERWCCAPLRSVAPDRLDRVRTAMMR